MFASCGTVAALAEIWTITTMAYERCRIICSPYIKKRLSAAQVSFPEKLYYTVLFTDRLFNADFEALLEIIAGRGCSNF